MKKFQLKYVALSVLMCAIGTAHAGKTGHLSNKEGTFIVGADCKTEIHLTEQNKVFADIPSPKDVVTTGNVSHTCAEATQLWVGESDAYRDDQGNMFAKSGDGAKIGLTLNADDTTNVEAGDGTWVLKTNGKRIGAAPLMFTIKLGATDNVQKGVQYTYGLSAGTWSD